jgi:hypothetical protein
MEENIKAVSSVPLNVRILERLSAIETNFFWKGIKNSAAFYVQ